MSTVREGGNEGRPPKVYSNGTGWIGVYYLRAYSQIRWSDLTILVRKVCHGRFSLQLYLSRSVSVCPRNTFRGVEKNSLALLGIGLSTVRTILWSVSLDCVVITVLYHKWSPKSSVRQPHNGKARRREGERSGTQERRGVCMISSCTRMILYCTSKVIQRRQPRF